MDGVRLAVLLVASVLVVGGMLAVGLRELATQERRHVAGPLRDAIEVALPVAFAFLLVTLIWMAR